MACFACRGGISRATSFKRKGAAGNAMETDQLRIEIHNADLLRSFAKAGLMNPYVVVSVDGREVYRSHGASKAPKNPRWEATCTVKASSMPSSVEIAVRSSNTLGSDTLCGSTLVPCSEGMEDFTDKKFTLKKREEETGSIRLSLSTIVPPTLLATSKSKQSLCRSKSFRHSGSSMMYDSTVNSDVVGEGEDGETEVPDDSPAEPSPMSEIPEGQVDAIPPIPEETAPEAVDLESLKVLMGSWTCIATQGLEEFLKQAGLGAFQRRIAMAAKWPSWDFNMSGDHIIFVNHAQLGDLKEEVVLDGSQYKHKDLQGHPLTCSAKWEKTEDGGLLTIWRECEVGPFYETRRVSGDTLEFVLTKGDGKSWGRTFKRA